MNGFRLEKRQLSKSEGETLRWAETLSTRFQEGDRIGLSGPLGAGKTVVAKGICAGLGVQGAINSPSYALVNQYQGKFPVHHLDLYRLNKNSDWHEIGLDHYLESEAVSLVEWPERIPFGYSAMEFCILIQPRAENDRELYFYRALS